MPIELQDLLEKTAAILEKTADSHDATIQQKTAAAKAEAEENIAPHVEQYEKFTGVKLAEEDREALLELPSDHPVLRMFVTSTAKLAEADTGKPTSVAAPDRSFSDSPQREPSFRRGTRRREAHEIRSQ